MPKAFLLCILLAFTLGAMAAEPGKGTAIIVVANSQRVVAASDTLLTDQEHHPIGRNHKLWVGKYGFASVSGVGQIDGKDLIPQTAFEELFAKKYTSDAQERRLVEKAKKQILSLLKPQQYSDSGRQTNVLGLILARVDSDNKLIVRRWGLIATPRKAGLETQLRISELPERSKDQGGNGVLADGNGGAATEQELRGQLTTRAKRAFPVGAQLALGSSSIEMRTAAVNFICLAETWNPDQAGGTVEAVELTTRGAQFVLRGQSCPKTY